MVNDLLAWLKYRQGEAMFFKVDFEKTYDMINLGFLYSMMSQIGFPDLWRV